MKVLNNGKEISFDGQPIEDVINHFDSAEPNQIVEKLTFQYLKIENIDENNNFNRLIDKLLSESNKYPKLKTIILSNNGLTYDNVDKIIDLTTDHNYKYLNFIEIIGNHINYQGYVEIINRFIDFKINKFGFGGSSDSNITETFLKDNHMDFILYYTETSMNSLLNDIYFEYALQYGTVSHVIPSRTRGVSHVIPFKRTPRVISSNQLISNELNKLVDTTIEFRPYKKYLMLNILNEILKISDDYSKKGTKNLSKRIQEKLKLLLNIVLKARILRRDDDEAKPKLVSLAESGFMNINQRLSKKLELNHIDLPKEKLLIILAVIMNEEEIFLIFMEYFRKVFLQVIKGMIDYDSIEMKEYLVNKLKRTNIIQKKAKTEDEKTKLGNEYFHIFSIIFYYIYEFLNTEYLYENFEYLQEITDLENKIRNREKLSSLEQLFVKNTSKNTYFSSTSSSTSSSKSSSTTSKNRNLNKNFDASKRRIIYQDLQAEKNERERESRNNKINDFNQKYRTEYTKEFKESQERQKVKNQSLENIKKDLRTYVFLANNKINSGESYKNAVDNNLDEVSNKKIIQKNKKDISGFLDILEKNETAEKEKIVILNSLKNMIQNKKTDFFNLETDLLESVLAYLDVEPSSQKILKVSQLQKEQRQRKNMSEQDQYSRLKRNQQRQIKKMMQEDQSLRRKKIDEIYEKKQNQILKNTGVSFPLIRPYEGDDENPSLETIMERINKLVRPPHQGDQKLYKKTQSQYQKLMKKK